MKQAFDILNNSYNTKYTKELSTTPFNESPDSILAKKLDMAKKFTRVYRENMNEHLAIKEANCMKVQFPAMCREFKDYDLIAGRVYYEPLVAFGIELYANARLEAITKDVIPHEQLPDEVKELRKRLGVSNGGFFFNYSELKKISAGLEDGSEEKKEIDDMIDFWLNESSRAKYNMALPEEIASNMGRSETDNRYISGFYRISCISLDFDTLLQRGISGMRKYIGEKKAMAIKNGGDVKLYQGMLMALDVLVDVCRYYEDMALAKAEKAEGKRKQELLNMAEALSNITVFKPAGLLEAVQLFWLYNILAGTVNFGRMDIYLGDFYVSDIDSGRLSEEEAIDILKSLWKIISEQRYDGLENARANSRFITGGRGRRNEKNADRFTLAAMETSRRMMVCEPNLTLRFYKGQNPALMDKAYDLLGEGCIHPTLYNDDAYVPWVMKAYEITEEDAITYIPEGCGEIMMDHRSVGSPNAIIKYVSALDLVLHNGIESSTGIKRGLSFGEPEGFDTFEKLVDAVKKQIDFTNDIMAKRHAFENRMQAKSSAYLYMSMLTDDCIEKGKSLFDSGARYLGGVIETFGLTNLADSLYVIKELVYEKKMYTLRQIVEMTDANFEGYERERQLMLSLPKFGNDHEGIDSLYTELNNFVCMSAYEKAKPAGLDFFLNCNLNTGGVTYGANTKASPDGRLYGEAFAVGNAPTAGRDKNGLTALLNSMLKHDKMHAGYVHNLKVSKKMFDPENRPKFRALMDAFFENGSEHAMITVLNKEDLENALKEPEKYTNLLVRVGGWTAKFVELPEKYQIEIVNRTIY